MDKKKKVGFNENLNEYAGDCKTIAILSSLIADLEKKRKDKSKQADGKPVNLDYLSEVYSEIALNQDVKTVCANMITSRISKWAMRINKEDGFYPAQPGVQDLKPLINKWNADITKLQLLNKLVKPNDTVKTKTMISQNLAELSKNHENFNVSAGYKGIEEVLGQEKIEILTKEKQMQDTLMKSRADPIPTYTERKKQIQQENEIKMKDTQNLIEKVTKTRIEIKQKQKHQMAEKQKLDAQLAEKQEKELKKQNEEREKLKEQKLKEIEDKRRKIEEAKEKQSLQTKEYLKKYNVNKPRYIELEERYNENNRLSYLEQKKRMLASVRDLHQPLNMERIEQEQAKYEEIIRENNAKKRQELIQKLKEYEQTYDYRKYKTKYIDKVIEDEIINKEKYNSTKEQAREWRDKLKEYDEIVKQKYAPVPSKRKQIEIEQIKHELTMSPRDKYRRSSPIMQSDKEDMHAIAEKRRKIFEWKNPLKPPTPVPKREFITIDYLKEFQKEKQDDFERTGKAPVSTYRDIQYNKLDGTEKFSMVKSKVDMIESEAKNIQKYLNIKGNATAKEKDHANDLLFKSMNAKLSLLQSTIKDSDK